MSYLHLEGDAHFKVECAVHDLMYGSSLRLYNLLVVIGCHLEISHFRDISFFLIQTFICCLQKTSSFYLCQY